jgi:hypothetical protein
MRAVNLQDSRNAAESDRTKAARPSETPSTVDTNPTVRTRRHDMVDRPASRTQVPHHGASQDDEHRLIRPSCRPLDRHPRLGSISGDPSRLKQIGDHRAPRRPDPSYKARTGAFRATLQQAHPARRAAQRPRRNHPQCGQPPKGVVPGCSTRPHPVTRVGAAADLPPNPTRPAPRHKPMPHRGLSTSDTPRPGTRQISPRPLTRKVSRARTEVRARPAPRAGAGGAG